MYAALIVVAVIVVLCFLSRSHKNRKAVKLNLKFGKPQNK